MTTRINGKTIILNKDDLDKRLLTFLREDLDLTGSKDGCGTGACGACTILVDNKPVRSCMKRVSYIIDREITTIEGMEQEDGTPHPLQQAFIDKGAVQCGFCTPGMILTSHAFLLENPSPTREEIRRVIRPNLCRCTGYQKIVDAVEEASRFYRR